MIVLNRKEYENKFDIGNVTRNITNTPSSISTFIFLSISYLADEMESSARLPDHHSSEKMFTLSHCDSFLYNIKVQGSCKLPVSGLQQLRIANHGVTTCFDLKEH